MSHSVDGPVLVVMLSDRSGMCGYVQGVIGCDRAERVIGWSVCRVREGVVLITLVIYMLLLSL